MIKPKGYRSLQCLFALILVSFGPALLSAHPHVFIDTSLVVQGDTVKPTQLNVEWRFDEIFSQSVFADFPKPKSGVYTGKGLADLEDGAFSNLKEYGYFAKLTIDGKKQAVKSVKNFSARVDRGWVIYGFDIPLGKTTAATKLSISFFDDTFFVAFGQIEHAQVSQKDLPAGSRLDFGERTLKSDFGPMKVDEISLVPGGSP